MGAFDAVVFAREAVSEVRHVLENEARDAAEARNELAVLEADIAATIAALDLEKDFVRARALQTDLEMFLPARKAAILSAAKSKATGDAMVLLEVALSLALKVASAAARAFVPALGGL